MNPPQDDEPKVQDTELSRDAQHRPVPDPSSLGFVGFCDQTLRVQGNDCTAWAQCLQEIVNRFLQDSSQINDPNNSSCDQLGYHSAKKTRTACCYPVHGREWEHAGVPIYPPWNIPHSTPLTMTQSGQTAASPPPIHPIVEMRIPNQQFDAGVAEYILSYSSTPAPGHQSNASTPVTESKENVPA